MTDYELKNIHIKKQTLILILGLATILTNCGCPPACSSEIRNQSSSDIYVVLKTEGNGDISFIKPFVTSSKVSKFKLDTITNTGTFLISPGGHLLTYDGPGTNPAKLLGYLKIITDKQIIEMKSQDEINDKFDKQGVLYTMTFK